jgi:glutathione S-transferase
MQGVRLVIANKVYSSWSLRAWLALKTAGIAFEEVLIPLDQPDTRARITTHSPSGLVPCLLWPSGRCWDSLAIAETVAEWVPQAGLWPGDPALRAWARSLCAEMHSGFTLIRQRMSMDLRRQPAPVPVDGALQAQLDRLFALWAEARAAHAAAGPFLFGTFCLADCFYAPVATRMISYAVPLPAAAQAYVNAVIAHPALREWTAAAVAEPWHLPNH